MYGVCFVFDMDDWTERVLFSLQDINYGRQMQKSRQNNKAEGPRW